MGLAGHRVPAAAERSALAGQWLAEVQAQVNQAVAAALPELAEYRLERVEGLENLVDRFLSDVDPEDGNCEVTQVGRWQRHTGSVPVRVSVRAGEDEINRWLTAEISAMVRVPVLAADKMRGDLLTADDFVLATIDARQVDADCLAACSPDDLFEALRPLATGEPVSRRQVRPYRLVKRGDMVAVSLERDGISIRTKGVALAAGTRNEVIPVLNPRSRRQYQAQVVGLGTVRVVY
jgi:flagella basal body P-ring formation protein FlgA